MATTKSDDAKGTRAGPRKRDAVAEITEKLGRATSAIITDFRGLTVSDLEEVRAQLRKEGVEYVIVKNTLARRAADEANLPEFKEVLTGPVGLALGYGDAAVPARLVNDYFKATKRLPIMSGLVEGRVLNAKDAQTLADLPPREVLLAQLAGTLQSPLTRLAGAMDSILSTFAATLDAYRVQLESAA